MGFKDVLKKSFLDNFSSAELSTATIVMSLLFTAVLGLYIFGIYQVTTKKTIYSRSFNISLAAIAVITAAIIISVQSSVVISLGMVGALSIVRFRTAVKDPMDLIFLFWAISVGIICGAGLLEVALIMSAVVTGVVFLLEHLPYRRESMLLLINATEANVEGALKEILPRYAKTYKVKSRNLTAGGMDMIIELQVKEGESLVKDVSGIESVVSVSLLSHDGEVTY